jgi:hypothetical protein
MAGFRDVTKGFVQLHAIAAADCLTRTMMPKALPSLHKFFARIIRSGGNGIAELDASAVATLCYDAKQWRQEVLQQREAGQGAPMKEVVVMQIHAKSILLVSMKSSGRTPRAEANNFGRSLSGKGALAKT